MACKREKLIFLTRNQLWEYSHLILYYNFKFGYNNNTWHVLKVKEVIKYLICIEICFQTFKIYYDIIFRSLQNIQIIKIRHACNNRKLKIIMYCNNIERCVIWVKKEEKEISIYLLSSYIIVSIMIYSVSTLKKITMTQVYTSPIPSRLYSLSYIIHRTSKSLDILSPSLQLQQYYLYRRYRCLPWPFIPIYKYIYILYTYG